MTNDSEKKNFLISNKKINEQKYLAESDAITPVKLYNNMSPNSSDGEI
jgi:hypothetical protein